MNEFEAKTWWIVGGLILVGVIALVYLLRKRITSITVSAGDISADVRAEQAKGSSVRGLNQCSKDGSNEATIKSSSVDVNGVTQRAKGNNTFSIGGD